MTPTRLLKPYDLGKVDGLVTAEIILNQLRQVAYQERDHVWGDLIDKAHARLEKEVLKTKGAKINV